MNITGGLATAGLMARGYNDALEDNNKLAEQEQIRLIRQQGLEDAKAAAPLIGQRVEAGRRQARSDQIGLDDLERNTAGAAADRAAAAGGKSQYESFGDMATAREARGDFKEANEYRELQKRFVKEGFADVVDAIMMNPTPGPRPDVLKAFNSKGAHNDLRAAEYDGQGMLTVTDKDGVVKKHNIAQIGSWIGALKPTVRTVAPGATERTTEPLTGTTRNYTAPDKEHPVVVPQDSSVYDPVSKTFRSPSGAESGAGGQSVRRNIPVIEAGRQAMMDLPEMTKEAPSDPNDPTSKTTKVLTPQGQAIAPLVGSLLLGGNNLPPAKAAQIAKEIYEKEAKGIKSIEEIGGQLYVKHGNAWYKLANEGVQAPAGAAPTVTAPPQRTAATGKPVVAPTAQLGARAAAGITAVNQFGEPQTAPISAPTAAQQNGLPPRLPEPEQVTGTPAERMKARRDAGSTERERQRIEAPKKRIAETFRVIIKEGYRKADAPLIQEAIDTGMLTNQEMATAKAMLSSMKTGSISGSGLGN